MLKSVTFMSNDAIQKQPTACIAKPAAIANLGAICVSRDMKKKAVQFPRPRAEISVLIASSGYPRKSCSNVGNNTKVVKLSIPTTNAISVPIAKFRSIRREGLRKGWSAVKH